MQFISGLLDAISKKIIVMILKLVNHVCQTKLGN